MPKMGSNSSKMAGQLEPGNDCFLNNLPILGFCPFFFQSSPEAGLTPGLFRRTWGGYTIPLECWLRNLLSEGSLPLQKTQSNGILPSQSMHSKASDTPKWSQKTSCRCMTHAISAPEDQKINYYFQNTSMPPSTAFSQIFF